MWCDTNSPIKNIQYTSDETYMNLSYLKKHLKLFSLYDIYQQEQEE